MPGVASASEALITDSMRVDRGGKIPVALRHYPADVRPSATHDADPGIDGLLGGQQKCRLARLMRAPRDRIDMGGSEWTGAHSRTGSWVAIPSVASGI